ncbi:MAG TPA: ABC transporter permease [Fimbriimonadaceae bacterium]|nr:ABC transporter permease [Fimbriimonadaceae bacterium]
MAAGLWLGENVRVYLRNATAVRDFRVQLRGNRSILLWSIYLAVLIGFAMLTYVSSASEGSMSIAEAQSTLYTFFRTVMGLLTTMVMLIAPALTATAVVSERQRQSLDLVFSAPVSPKYYLVGKMLSSYRYIWMLLVLSLPVTAACIVLGGATWSEVLVSYALLSMHGLLFTAIALLISTLSQKPTGAIVWSYVIVFAYTFYISFLVSLPAFVGVVMGAGSLRGLGEAPMSLALSPYSNVEAASTFTDINGIQVPNWILASLVILLLVKLLLLGAGSSLSHLGSPVTKSLRIHALAYLFAVTMGLTFVWSQVYGMAGMVSSTGASPAATSVGRFLIVAILFLVPVIPFISCYGRNLEKKFWPDGSFNVRRMLLGTPSGGLPFLLALVLCAAAGIFVSASSTMVHIYSQGFLSYLLYGLGLMAFLWSIGRGLSAMNENLRVTRTQHFAVLICLLVLPLPFLGMADPYSFDQATVSLWDLFILRPLYSVGDRSMHALALGLVLAVIAAMIEGANSRSRAAQPGEPAS